MLTSFQKQKIKHVRKTFRMRSIRLLHIFVVFKNETATNIINVAYVLLVTELKIIIFVL